MILEIDDFLVSSEILTEYFCCDYQKCKGCCCVIGDSGAPLLSEEVEKLKAQYSSYSHFLSEAGGETVKNNGVSCIDSDGDLVTPLVTGSGECAFSYTNAHGFTLCAVEKGWENDKSAGYLKKPISCWLYPIRVGKLRSGATTLILSREHLCTEAFEKGRREGVRVLEFLKEPLCYRFGNELYEKLLIAAKEMRK